MKVKKTKNCMKVFRNLPEYADFTLRVEYSDGNVVINYYNTLSRQFELCLSFDQVIDFPGYFVIAGNSGINNPDFHIVKQFMVYNTSQPLEKGEDTNKI